MSVQRSPIQSVPIQWQSLGVDEDSGGGNENGNAVHGGALRSMAVYEMTVSGSPSILVMIK